LYFTDQLDKTKLLSVGDITKDEARNSCTSDAQI